MNSLNLKPAHLMNVGAVCFAGFALWWITRKPAGALSAQPGQQQRDSALTGHLDTINQQWSDLVASATTQANGDASTLSDLLTP